MKDSHLQFATTMLGLVGAVVGLMGVLLEFPGEPQNLKAVSVIGYVLFAGGIIWFAFSSGEPPATRRWLSLSVLLLSTIAFSVWVGTWITTPRRAQSAPQLGRNPLITYFSFEGTDEGWAETDIAIIDQDGFSIAALSDGVGFPGSIISEVSSEHALEGANSLRVTTSVTEQGDYRGYLYRQGSISGYGMTIYVLVPEMPDACYVDYVQLCVPSHGWMCSHGTDLVPGEWTPLVIDLSQSYGGGELYNQKLTELAVQWRFYAESGTSFDLFFDAAEVFHSGTVD